MQLKWAKSLVRHAVHLALPLVVLFWMAGCSSGGSSESGVVGTWQVQSRYPSDLWFWHIFPDGYFMISYSKEEAGDPGGRWTVNENFIRLWRSESSLVYTGVISDESHMSGSVTHIMQDEGPWSAVKVDSAP